MAENKKNITYAMGKDTIAQMQSAYMNKVHGWMFGGLLITALTAYFVSGSSLYTTIVNSGLFWVLIIAQLGIVLALSAAIHKMSYQIAVVSFLAYSFLTGLVFSTIFVTYTNTSIYTTFLITAGTFGALSAYGYFTKKDLSGWGSFLFMGLIGVILASIVNIFFVSSALHFVINVVGILVFAGLTAYDTQRIKEMYVLQQEGDEVAGKGAIM